MSPPRRLLNISLIKLKKNQLPQLSFCGVDTVINLAEPVRTDETDINWLLCLVNRLNFACMTGCSSGTFLYKCLMSAVTTLSQTRLRCAPSNAVVSNHWYGEIFPALSVIVQIHYSRSQRTQILFAVRTEFIRFTPGTGRHFYNFADLHVVSGFKSPMANVTFDSDFLSKCSQMYRPISTSSGKLMPVDAPKPCSM